MAARRHSIQGRSPAPSSIAVELALLDDPLVRFVGALDAILAVVAFRRQKLRDFVDAACLAATMGARGVKHALSNLELVIASEFALRVGNRRAVRRSGGAEHLSWFDSYAMLSRNVPKGDYLWGITRCRIVDTNPGSDCALAHVRTNVMHRSARGALAVLLPLLLIATSARAQVPLPSGFVDAATVVDGLVLDMRYFGEHNFVGERIDGYERPRCLLSAQAATALAEVQRSLAARGLGLKVFDCYRPQRAVAHFVRWARKIDDVRRKSEFYPDLDKRVLFEQGYIAAHSGHSRGSTVDLTLVRRGDGSELDMARRSTSSARAGLAVRPQRRRPGAANRALLAAGDDRKRGFRPYTKEWWHFTLATSLIRRPYFDFPVR